LPKDSLQFNPGLVGVIATKSSISNVDGKNGILSYRGYDIEDLSNSSSFEEVSYLLLYADIPTKKQLDKFKKDIWDRQKLDDVLLGLMKVLPKNSHPMTVLQICCSAIATLNNKQSKEEQAINIIAKMGTIVSSWQNIRNDKSPILPQHNKSYAENFLHMMTAKKPNKDMIKIMDVCLILHAEHTINASTLSALVATSTLANLPSVIAGAIGTLAGELHGGANQKVMQMLKTISAVENVESWVAQQLKNKKVIWGMGHREYSTKDPRAVILERMLKEKIDTLDKKYSKMLAIALEIELQSAKFLNHKKVYANVDFYSGIVYSISGIDSDQYTAIFAIARATGWISHFFEQIEENKIFRPTQIYVGEGSRKYKTPI